jgi:hypothetical protein
MWSDDWSPTLRQGDIIGPIWMPMIGKKDLDVVGSVGIAAMEMTEPKQALVPISPRYVAVVSHDCEFNENKRERLLVARVQTIDPRMTPEQINEARESNDVEARHNANKHVDGVDSFVIDPIDGVSDAFQAVSFTTIMPVPMPQVTALLGAKVAELTHDQRLIYKRKLIWFFTRSNEDVPADAKRPRAEILAERAKP